jgi:hypothetical protein
MKTNGNEPAFSKAAYNDPYFGLDASNEGLTKREYFAAIAMQGIITNKDGLDIKIEYIVESAVDAADALIEELSKTKTNEEK